MTLKILIVGAGIAGPSAAYFLSLLPIPVSITLIERCTQPRLTGQQLDIRRHAIPLLRKMGIEEAVRSVRPPEEGTQWIDYKTGKVKAFIPAPSPSTSDAGSHSSSTENPSRVQESISSEFEIMRGDLSRILLSLTSSKPNVRHRYGVTISNMSPSPSSPGKVLAKLVSTSTTDPTQTLQPNPNTEEEKQEEEEYDLVIGADGTNSPTRSLMLGPSFPDPRLYLPYHVGFYTIRNDPESPSPPPRFTFCNIPVSTNNPQLARCLGSRHDNPDVTRVYMFARGPSSELSLAHRERNPSKIRDAWYNVFKDYNGWEGQRFLEALRRNEPETRDLYSTPMVHVNLPDGHWSSSNEGEGGNIVLLGDAAHGATINGLGTSWAMVGSYILAGEVGNAILSLQNNKTSTTTNSPGEGSKESALAMKQAINHACKQYEDIWRPVAMADHQTQENGSNGFDGQKFMFPKSKIGIWGIQTLLGVLSKSTWVMEKMMQGWSGGDWEPPKYEWMPDAQKKK